ncbi:disease resistance protein rps5 [Quercus suber]|uniref:Disease resistance protein rps5 n=1 Tax=Quercus suber TaxID=58331 RepID=A0AAW0M4C6_QUESU
MEKLAQFLEPEKLNQVLELGKKIWDGIGKLYNYHSSAGDHVNNLKRKWEELEGQKIDVEEKMKSELFPRKRPKREVELWLQEVETINGEIQTIEEEGGRGIWKYFPRMHMGKLACQKIQEVKELYQRGGFRDSLVVDPPVSHGEELPTTTFVGQSTTERTIERVREHLLDENFRRIAVYGMGGIGKTTVMKQINNDLSKERDKFDNIIWVTVSKSSSVFKLQEDIARKLKLDLTDSEDETTRAGKLNNELKNWKRYVLILDDMWEAFHLEDVGIPEPTPTNGCRLLLTTRSLEVCNRMDCVNIKMELLSEKESWNLFLDKVGRDVLNTQDIEPIVKEVVKECARLPLAIVTIAGSLKNDLQHCLLYCALFCEDHEFERDELIEDLIDEGIIERMESRQAESDRGHTMLNKLERACLLETGINRNVKLHDLIRDMALEIAVLLIYNSRITSLPNSISDLENLATLRLISCYNLYRLPSLAKLTALRKLDLEWSRIKEIPHGLEMLVNLRYLNLDTKIPEIPSGILSKLSQLQVLKFNCGKLNVEEIVSLKLECFKGAFCGADDFNKYVGSLREGRLSHYQFIAREMTAKIDDVYWESKGKCVILYNCDVSLLPKDAQTLKIYKCDNLRSSSDASYLECARELESISVGWCDEIEDVLSYSYTFPLQSLQLKSLGKLQVLFREEKVASPLDIPPVTFSYLKQFLIVGCPNIKELFTPGLLQNLANLEEIKVGHCERLEEIIGAASDEVEEEIEEEGKDTTIFPRLRELVLCDIPRLETICSSSNAIVCDSLQNIEIVKCPKLKRLPLSLRDEQLSSPPSSLRIITQKEWWELLEWDNHATKNALEPLWNEFDEWMNFLCMTLFSLLYLWFIFY